MAQILLGINGRNRKQGSNEARNPENGGDLVGDKDGTLGDEENEMSEPDDGDETS